GRSGRRNTRHRKERGMTAAVNYRGPDPDGYYQRPAGDYRTSGEGKYYSPDLKTRGLFEVNGDYPGQRFITNVRKIAGRTRAPRTPGSVLIAASTVLLAILGGGCFYVSWWGQYLFIWAVKHQDSTAM